MTTRTLLGALAGAAALTFPAAAATLTIPVLDDSNVVQDGGADDNNFGGRNEIIVSNSSATGANRRFGLLRFDLSSLAGQYSSIDSVTLKLTLSTTRAVPTTGQILDIFRLAEANAGWVEGIGNAGDSIANNVPNPGTNTYRAKSDDTVVANRLLWAGSAGLNTAGTDYFSSAMATTSAFGAGSFTAGQTISLTLSATGFTLDQMIGDWIDDGTSNAGLLIRGRSGTANGQIFFDSNETVTAGAVPAQLVINYTVPEPSAVVLLAAGLGLAGRRRRR